LKLKTRAPEVFSVSATITAEVLQTSQGQTIRLPDEFRFETPRVSIRREGEAVILEPLKSSHWPEGFFDAIRVDDPAFVRPPQGLTPPAPSLP
jgi:antitoxin VapB